MISSDPSEGRIEATRICCSAGMQRAYVECSASLSLSSECFRRHHLISGGMIALSTVSVTARLFSHISVDSRKAKAIIIKRYRLANSRFHGIIISKINSNGGF